jgi:hypothetical protein
MKKNGFLYIIYKNKNKNMKTTIEVNGYEIVIEETEGVVSVKAMQDDDIVEEFELETSESVDDEDVRDFEEFGGEEEEDFDDDSEDEDDDLEDEDEDEDDLESEDDAPKLESFQSFLKKRK